MTNPTYTVDAVIITGNTFKPAASTAAVNLPPSLMVFDGTTNSVGINPFSAVKEINLGGAFTIYALFKLADISNETEGVHYIYTHNDQPGGKEVYLRLRYIKAHRRIVTRVPVRTLVFARDELSPIYYKLNFGGSTLKLYNNRDAPNNPLFEIWKPIEGNEGAGLSKIDGDNPFPRRKSKQRHIG